MVSEALSEQELKDFFQAGCQLWDVGPNNTRIPMGWGMTKSELLRNGFTKAELEKYVKKGHLGKTMVRPSQGKEIDMNCPIETMYFYATTEKIRKAY